jgi:hypothetical protein
MSDQSRYDFVSAVESMDGRSNEFTCRAIGQLQWWLNPNRSKQTKRKEAWTTAMAVESQPFKADEQERGISQRSGDDQGDRSAGTSNVRHLSQASLPSSVQVSLSVRFSLPPARGAKLSGCTALFRWRMYQTVPPRSDLGWRRGLSVFLI